LEEAPAVKVALDEMEEKVADEEATQTLKLERDVEGDEDVVVENQWKSWKNTARR